MYGHQTHRLPLGHTPYWVECRPPDPAATRSEFSVVYTGPGVCRGNYCLSGFWKYNGKLPFCTANIPPGSSPTAPVCRLYWALFRGLDERAVRPLPVVGGGEATGSREAPTCEAFVSCKAVSACVAATCVDAFVSCKAVSACVDAACVDAFVSCKAVSACEAAFGSRDTHLEGF